MALSHKIMVSIPGYPQTGHNTAGPDDVIGIAHSCLA
jgi:hypothetical protein